MTVASRLWNTTRSLGWSIRTVLMACCMAWMKISSASSSRATGSGCRKTTPFSAAWTITTSIRLLWPGMQSWRP
uniref:Uncharacterized protein n=1 Tax=uncultured marine virus TaxID=186617 RepID=A0A0F7L2U6_9VIRU|nr:hypothetical protein [uncultured marine virus]